MSSATGLPETWSPCWLQPFANSSTGGAAAPAQEEMAGRQTGTGNEPHGQSGFRGRSPGKIRHWWEKSRPRSPARRTRSDKGPAPAVGAWGRSGRRRRRSRPPSQAGRRPRLTPAPAAPHGAGRPDSPSRAVPMSWSSRARICAWADMVASERSRSGCDGSSVSDDSSDDNEGWSRRPQNAQLLPVARDAGRKCVGVGAWPAGKCSLWDRWDVEQTHLWRGVEETQAAVVQESC